MLCWLYHFSGTAVAFGLLCSCCLAKNSHPGRPAPPYARHPGTCVPPSLRHLYCAAQGPRHIDAYGGSFRRWLQDDNLWLSFQADGPEYNLTLSTTKSFILLWLQTDTIAAKTDKSSSYNCQRPKQRKVTYEMVNTRPRLSKNGHEASQAKAAFKPQDITADNTQAQVFPGSSLHWILTTKRKTIYKKTPKRLGVSLYKAKLTNPSSALGTAHMSAYYWVEFCYTTQHRPVR